MFTSLRRIIKSGFAGFYRNFSVSASAVLIIAIALLALSSIYLGGNVLNASIKQLENKVDVNVYFYPSAEVELIKAIQGQLEQISQVASVEYVDRDQALVRFKERNKDNPVIIASLEVLDDNPLGASFNIKATEISQYESIAGFLDQVQVQEEFKGVIDTVNYNQNRQAIEKIQTLIDYSQQFGMILIVILVFLSVIIVYNTIRLTIYTVREEIAVMRLVGASRFFARGPFVVEGVLYGVMGAVLALAVLWPSVYYAAPYLQEVFVMNVYELFTDELTVIASGMFGVGVSLGLLSSALAIRKYLDI